MIYAGGTVTGVTAKNGGQIGVRDTEITVLVGKTSSGLLVYQGGIETVSAGGTAIGTQISGGDLNLYDGKAVSATITDGGQAYVYNDGVVSGATIAGGSGGSPSLLYIGALCVASGMTVRDGGELQVDGHASGVTVLSGGTVAWDYGAVVEHLTIRSGGAEELYSGGLLQGATIGNSVTLEVDGEVSGTGSAVNVTVASGGTIVNGGGFVSGLKIETGGSEIIGSGATVQ